MKDIGKARRRPKKRRINSKGRTTLDGCSSATHLVDKVPFVGSQGHPEQEFRLELCRNPISDATRTSLFTRSKIQTASSPTIHH